MKFFGETFAQFKKTFYLCIAFQGKHLTREAGSNFQTPHERGWKKQESSNSYSKSLWALSSAGSERLPYKQRVGGSNPSAPTHWKSSTYGSFRKCFFHTWSPILKTMRKQTRNLLHKSPWFSLSLTHIFWSKSNLRKIATATPLPPVSRHEMPKTGSKHV